MLSAPFGMFVPVCLFIHCHPHSPLLVIFKGTDCLHISGAAKRVTQNKGNFTTWSKRRSLDQETWRRSKEQRQAKISHLLDFIQGAGTYANVMKQVNSKKKLVEKLELEAEAEAEKYAGLAEDEELPLRLQDGGLLDQPALQVKEVAFAYPGGPELFSNVEIGVAVDTRLVSLRNTLLLPLLRTRVLSLSCAPVPSCVFPLAFGFPSICPPYSFFKKNH